MIQREADNIDLHLIGSTWHCVAYYDNAGGVLSADPTVTIAYAYDVE